MTTIFKCRMPDQDGDAWTDVKAYDAESAAIEYAQDCDSSAGGDLFNDCGTQIVHVKDEQGVERKFSCTMELEPSYSAEEIDAKPEPASDIPV